MSSPPRSQPAAPLHVHAVPIQDAEMFYTFDDQCLASPIPNAGFATPLQPRLPDPQPSPPLSTPTPLQQPQPAQPQEASPPVPLRRRLDYIRYTSPPKACGTCVKLRIKVAAQAKVIKEQATTIRLSRDVQAVKRLQEQLREAHLDHLKDVQKLTAVAKEAEKRAMRAGKTARKLKDELEEIKTNLQSLENGAKEWEGKFKNQVRKRINKQQKLRRAGVGDNKDRLRKIKTDLRKLLYVMDSKCVSDSAWRSIAECGDEFPRASSLVELRKEINAKIKTELGLRSSKDRADVDIEKVLLDVSLF